MRNKRDGRKNIKNLINVMDGIKCDGRNNLKKLINVMDGINVMEGKISKKKE